MRLSLFAYVFGDVTGEWFRLRYSSFTESSRIINTDYPCFTLACFLDLVILHHHQGSPEESKPNQLKSEIPSLSLDEQVLHIYIAVYTIYQSFDDYYLDLKLNQLVLE